MKERKSERFLCVCVGFSFRLLAFSVSVLLSRLGYLDIAAQRMEGEERRSSQSSWIGYRVSDDDDDDDFEHRSPLEFLPQKTCNNEHEAPQINLIIGFVLA